MSVLIKGMDMPESCWECPLCTDCFGDPCYCLPADTDFYKERDQYAHCRPEWCPLEEVKEEKE